MEEPLPFLVSWNLTKRCNLKCAHCYLDASELEGGDDTSTLDAIRTIDEIASLNPSAMLIMTGGEPLLRKDLFELCSYATGKGLMVVLGTNGTLIDDDIARKLISSGVKGVGISLDSALPAYHDRFRGMAGAWQASMNGIEALKRSRLDFQIQLTVTRENRRDIASIIGLGIEKGARAVNIFFLVCTGRGQDMSDLSPSEYEEVLSYLVAAEKEFEDKIMVRARCAPHFLRVAARLNPESAVLRGETSGCIAGRGYMRITPEGYATPCPYIPADADGRTHDLRKKSLKEIWFDAPVFRALRSPSYGGNCKDCEFNDVCGGCRARAYARTGDLMGEDPWCEYKPEGRPDKKPSPDKGTKPAWSREAEERLARAPFFLRGMVRKGVERYAMSKGLSEITPELMGELKRLKDRAGQ